MYISTWYFSKVIFEEKYLQRYPTMEYILGHPKGDNKKRKITVNSYKMSLCKTIAENIGSNHRFRESKNKHSMKIHSMKVHT